MKRKFLLVLTVLISLYNAYAQEEIVEEKVLGMTISSLLILLPIAMVVIGLLFFIGLYFKDHYGNITNFFKGIFKKRKLKGRVKKVTDYPQEVLDLQKQLPALESENAIERLSNIAKRFFSEKFSLDYEFTHGELEKELEKEKKEWASFPRKLSDLRYSGEPLSKKEVNELVKEFWDIVKYEKKKRLSLTVMEKLKKRKLSFEIDVLANLKRYLQKAKPKKKERLTTGDVIKYFIKRQKQNLSKSINIFKKIKADATTEIKTQVSTAGKIKDYFLDKLTEKRIKEILNLIEEAQKQITKGDINQAKNTYKHAYKLYYHIPIEEQLHIITELQKIQKQIREYKIPKQKETLIQHWKNQINQYIQQKRIKQRLTKINNLIEEIQKQIIKGKINQAKNTYKHAYKLYYHIPIEEQIHIITELQKIQKQIREYKIPKPKRIPIKKIEKRAEQQLIKQSMIKINNLIQQIGQTEQKLTQQITTKEDRIKEYIKQKIATQKITKIKDLIEEAQKQITKGDINQAKNTYKHAYKLYYHIPIEEQASILSQLRKIKRQIIDSEKDIETLELEKLAQELSKLKSQRDIYVIFDKSIVSKKLGSLINYIQEVKKQGIHGLKAGKTHLKEKIRDILESVEKLEKRGIRKLTHKEKEFFNFLKIFLKKKEKIIYPIEEGKRIPEYRHMKRKEIPLIEKQILQKEKLKIKPLIEIPKIRVDIKNLKKLEKEEENIMDKLQKVPQIYPHRIQRIQKKRLEKYNWEIMADEIKRKKTKNMLNLLKEEEKILSKLNELEKDFNT